jgi:hypothetical protein
LAFAGESRPVSTLAAHHEGHINTMAGDGQAGLEVDPMGGSFRDQRSGKGAQLPVVETLADLGRETVEKSLEFGRLACRTDPRRGSDVDRWLYCKQSEPHVLRYTLKLQQDR